MYWFCRVSNHSSSPVLTTFFIMQGQKGSPFCGPMHAHGIIVAVTVALSSSPTKSGHRLGNRTPPRLQIVALGHSANGLMSDAASPHTKPEPPVSLRTASGGKPNLAPLPARWQEVANGTATSIANGTELSSLFYSEVHEFTLAPPPEPCRTNPSCMCHRLGRSRHLRS